jgi:hypothetical protein
MSKYTLFKISLLGLMVTLLTACQPEPTDYKALMTHPEALERDMGRCQINEKIAADCEVVRRASADFAMLVSDRAANPEAFGMKILAAQTALGIAKTALQNNDKDASAQQNYNDQLQKVNVLLAAVAATSLVDN